MKMNCIFQNANENLWLLFKNEFLLYLRKIRQFICRSIFIYFSWKVHGPCDPFAARIKTRNVRCVGINSKRRPALFSSSDISTTTEREQYNYYLLRQKLTSKYMQWVHRAPMAAVPNRPKMSPPFLNAFGMARMPEPRLLLIRCNKAPLALKQSQKPTEQLIDVRGQNSVIIGFRISRRNQRENISSDEFFGTRRFWRTDVSTIIVYCNDRSKKKKNNKNSFDVFRVVNRFRLIVLLKASLWSSSVNVKEDWRSKKEGWELVWLEIIFIHKE